MPCQLVIIVESNVQMEANSTRRNVEYDLPVTRIFHRNLHAWERHIHHQVLRAFYEWLLDNQLTPHLVVDVTLPGVQVPTR